jgi:glycosyltransferase involved in cell wall biosynthesis
VRILLACVYFPPAGGAGVVRPLKLAGHLAQLGHEVHVLAPDDPKWVHRDETLAPPPGVAIHRTHNPGPPAAHWLDLPATRGLERLRLLARLNARRLSVPDAAVYWSLGSIRAAARLVEEREIDVLVTTSPPISVNLLGAAVKRLRGTPWVADLRDSLLSPDRRRHVRGERPLRRLVASGADAVVCVTQGIAAEMRAVGTRGPVETIENGADFEDFEGLEYRPRERFRITHAGSFVGPRNAGVFLDALARADDAVARFVGDFPSESRAQVAALGLDGRVELLGYRTRRETLALLHDSDALLLLVTSPKPSTRAVVTAKLWEYLAAGRPILAVVPPDGEAAALVRETGAGIVVAPDDAEGVARALADLARRWEAGELEPVRLTPEQRHRLSRRERAERFEALLGRVVERAAHRS